VLNIEVCDPVLKVTANNVSMYHVTARAFGVESTACALTAEEAAEKAKGNVRRRLESRGLVIPRRVTPLD